MSVSVKTVAPGTIKDIVGEGVHTVCPLRVALRLSSPREVGIGFMRQEPTTEKTTELLI